MKKIYSLLKIWFWANIGVFLGKALYEVIWYRTHPEIYELTSAPWYTNILVSGIFAFLTAFFLGTILWILKRKIDKEK